jgi:addiction module HigA family antidote
VLTKYLAKELGPRRIAVNVVAPGPIATDFSAGMVRDNPEVNKRIAAARRLGISLNRLNEIVLGKRGITADTAIRLARLLKTSPQLWMRLQADWDLHEAIRLSLKGRSQSNSRRFGRPKPVARVRGKRTAADLVTQKHE